MDSVGQSPSGSLSFVRVILERLPQTDEGRRLPAKEVLTFARSGISLCAHKLRGWLPSLRTLPHSLRLSRSS